MVRFILILLVISSSYAYQDPFLQGMDYFTLYDSIKEDVLMNECEVRKPVEFDDSETIIYDDPEMATVIIIDNIYLEKNDPIVIIDPYRTSSD